MSKEQIEKQQLIAYANELLQAHENYIEGAQVTDVQQHGDVLTFRGEVFLDEQGLPTPSTPLAFNLYKWLCHHLSKTHQLV